MQLQAAKILLLPEMCKVWEEKGQESGSVNPNASKMRIRYGEV